MDLLCLREMASAGYLFHFVLQAKQYKRLASGMPLENSTLQKLTSDVITALFLY
jgi:hypothetical protein